VEDSSRNARKKASDFPQELLDLLDSYVHGAIGRREFLSGAQKFATGAVTAAALVEMLRPNYAWAIQVPEDDKRLKTEAVSVPSPNGTGKIDCYLVRPAAARGKLPAALRAPIPEAALAEMLYRAGLPHWIARPDDEL